MLRVCAHLGILSADHNDLHACFARCCKRSLLVISSHIVDKKSQVAYIVFRGTADDAISDNNNDKDVSDEDQVSHTHEFYTYELCIV